MDPSALASGGTTIRALSIFGAPCTIEVDSFDAYPQLQSQLYRLTVVRNDLHIAEFFEPIFAEFNANP
jgi:hypothetical protein